MTDSNEETLVPLAKASGMLPEKNGKRIHPSTLHRWHRTGVRGVKLQCTRIGNEWYTSQKFINDFREALNRFEPLPAGFQKKNLDRIEEELKRRKI